jgi:hypothetical protein
MGRRPRAAGLSLVVSLLTTLSACTGDDVAAPGSTSATPAPTTAVATSPPTQPADDALIAEVEAAVAAQPAGCDPLDTRHCLLPFPSDHFTVDDATPTGKRIRLPVAGMPANAQGTPIEPAEWNRNDGWSPNAPMLTFVPGLDAASSRLPSWTDPAASLADDSPVVLIDSDTRERIPLFAELDARAARTEDRLLVVRPLVPLTEGHHHVIALRDLRTPAGTPVPPDPVFVAYRDQLTTGVDEVEDRRAQIEQAVFTPLAEAGIDRDLLDLAWDFTVASTESITGRMLHIRDRGLAALGDAPPVHAIDQVVEQPLAGIERLVVGGVTVPNFLTGDGSSGNGFHYADSDGDPDRLPAQNGTVQAPFQCIIPASALTAASPVRISYYGHGLFGTEEQVASRSVRAMAVEHAIVFCGTRWAGTSEDDVLNAVAVLQDISRFPTFADRLQQGLLNHIVLGDLITDGAGLAAHPAFQRPDGQPVFDPTHLFYDGNSQGGIMGLALAAVSPHIERAVLGVPGMNYSLLLPRSVDFDVFESVFNPAYPDELARPIILGLTQMLWDRGEGAGYAPHVTSDPLPGTRPKAILLHVALGDHQVSEISAFIEARALGAAVHRPVAAPGRMRSDDVAWGLPSLDGGGDGSGLVVWDSGAPPIPIENQPPRQGHDPHSDPRNDPDVRRQKSAFLQPDGVIVDVCGGAACAADAVPD